MTADLDALEALAKAARERGYGDVTRVSSLIDALESTLAELRQERERRSNLATEHRLAGESWDRTRTRLEGEVLTFREQYIPRLSRAEETLEKVHATLGGYLNPGGAVMTALHFLTEYAKQKGESDD